MRLFIVFYAHSNNLNCKRFMTRYLGENYIKSISANERSIEIENLNVSSCQAAIVECRPSHLSDQSNLSDVTTAQLEIYCCGHIF